MNEQEALLPLHPGERLHAARRSKSLTRSDVAARLKCAEELVTAMENGEPSGLAPVYHQGFLKAYMQLLDLPPEDRAELLADTASGDPAVRSVFPAAVSAHPADRWLRAASYVLASLLVGTLAWQLAHEVARLSQVEQAEVAGSVVDFEVAPDSGRESGAHVNASIASLEALNSGFNPRAGANAGTQAWEALERAGEDALAKGEYLLDISASADSWVEIRDVEGGLLEHDLLRGGASRQYRGFGPFRITLGRTTALEFAINGQVVDLSSYANDDVTQMLLDPEQLLARSDTPTGAD